VVSTALLTLGAAPAPEPPGLAATARQFQAIHPPEERDVPPEARSLMTAWKQQIRDLIGRELNGGPYQTATAERIADHLKAALAREGVPVSREPSPGTAGPYGWIGDLEVQRPAGHDRLLAVTVTQEISCGSDASLYLFRWEEKGWSLAFALESNGYEQVNGGLGSFQFGVSPPDKAGGFFLVAASINPWCSSSWQGIRYRAYRVGGDPLRLVPFFEEIAGIFEWDYDLTVEADRFRLTFRGNQSLDAGILIRDYVRAFRVTGTKAERIGPLAKEPQGFIDEWIGQPWEIAKRWTLHPERPAMKAWHDRLKERTRDLSTSFDSLETCGPSRSQATLDLDPDQKSPSLPRVLYFTVRSVGEDFRMERIDVSEEEECPLRSHSFVHHGAGSIRWPVRPGVSNARLRACQPCPG
jgi:hypothetical protein